MEEFKLSDKEIEACLEDHSEGKYRKSDVKEFIRLFKERMLLHKRETKWRLSVVEYYKIIEIIDKLAGDLK